jgi:alkanesulfonate monooxygenase SsuD/methylene tetrahydromethanopterin reductase-like flavin-dependent oxidoreductase (luciferase family)
MDAAVIRRALGSVPVQMAEEFILAGSPGEIGARLARYSAVGMDHVVLGDITGLCHEPETAAKLQSALPELCGLLRGMDATQPDLAILGGGP